MKSSKKILIDRYYEEYTKKYKKEKIVRGCGSINALYVFIGEAPGKNELKEGRPFVGKAGKKFDEFLESLELSREEIYITNSIKYGLRKYSKETKRYSNRPARVKEIEENMPYLSKEIDIIAPKLVVTMGNIPLKTILKDKNASIGSLHGGIINSVNYDIFPLYHPASLIYNPSLKTIFEEDISRLKIYLKNN